MIELRLTGYPCLRREGTLVSGQAGQRHRLALLALLATSAERTLSRDRLVAILWPDSDDHRARNLLNVAVHAIRKALGEESLISRGDSLVLGSGVAADVCDFRRAARSGELHDALQHYRGPFLDGFHLERAAEFDQWASLIRATLATEYRDLIEQLAREAAEAGDLPGAAQRWRALVNADPLNTRAVVQLMLTLERQGDYGNAIQLAHEHQDHLRDELEARPDAEFEALVRRLREHPLSRPLAWEGSEVPRQATRPEPAPRALPRLGRRVVILGSLAAAAWWAVPVALRRSTADGPAENASSVVAVLPFAVRGGVDTLLLGTGLAELLSTALDVPGEWRPVDPTAVDQVMRGAIDTSAASRRRLVTQRLNLDRVVTGEVTHVANYLRISATVWAGDSALHNVAVSGPVDSLFVLMDQVVRGVYGIGGQRSDAHLLRLAARTTPSVPALRAFLSGSAAYRRGEYAEAATWFARAIETDSAFSLAHYRLATAVEWLWQYDRARAALGRALGAGTRLGPTDRLMAQALQHFLNGASRAAEKLYGSIVALRPEDHEAWYHLADLQFHSYAVRDRPMQDSRSAWINALGADSSNSGALLHLARVSALDDDTLSTRVLLDAIRRRSRTGDRLWEQRAYVELASAEPERHARFLREVTLTGDSTIMIPFQALSAFTDHLDASRQLGEVLRRSPRVSWRAYALHRLAEVEWMAGRPAAAEHRLAELATMDSEMALAARAYFATLPGERTPPATLDSLQQAIRRLPFQRRPLPLADAVQPFATVPAIYPEVKLYLLGRLAAASGYWPQVDSLVQAMSQTGAPEDLRGLRHDMARSLRAQLALARGDTARADSLLRSATIETSVERLNSSWFFSQTVEQYQRAELAVWRGREDVALQTFGAVRHSLVMTVPAVLRVAQLHERRGEIQQARREYARIVRLHANSEPERRMLLREATAGLARLSR